MTNRGGCLPLRGQGPSDATPPSPRGRADSGGGCGLSTAVTGLGLWAPLMHKPRESRRGQRPWPTHIGTWTLAAGAGGAGHSRRISARRPAHPLHSGHRPLPTLHSSEDPRWDMPQCRDTQPGDAHDHSHSHHWGRPSLVSLPHPVPTPLTSSLEDGLPP